MTTNMPKVAPLLTLEQSGILKDAVSPCHCLHLYQLGVRKRTRYQWLVQNYNWRINTYEFDFERGRVETDTIIARLYEIDVLEHPAYFTSHMLEGLQREIGVHITPSSNIVGFQIMGIPQTIEDARLPDALARVMITLIKYKAINLREITCAIRP